MKEVERKIDISEGDSVAVDQLAITAIQLRLKQFEDKGLEAARRVLMEEKKNV